MSDGDVPWLLLERYCAGACTAEEQAALDSWLAGDPRRRLLAERLRTMFGEAPPTPDRREIEKEWTKLVATTRQSPTSSIARTILLVAGILSLLGVAWFVASHAVRP